MTDYSYPRKTIQELYNSQKAEAEKNGNYFSESYWTPGDYTDLITLGDEEIVSSVDIGDYQGDSLVLVKHPTLDLYGLIEYGWGSCSGCDVLQSCAGSISELQALADSMIPSNEEWKTAAEMLVYFQERNWSDHYFYRDEAVQKWVAEVIELLSQKTGA